MLVPLLLRNNRGLLGTCAPKHYTHSAKRAKRLEVSLTAILHVLHDNPWHCDNFLGRELEVFFENYRLKFQSTKVVIEEKRNVKTA